VGACTLLEEESSIGSGGSDVPEAAKQKPMWLRIVQYPPVRLGIFGTIMFYMLGFSNNFLGQAAGNIWA
jgi:hypothetical protein